MASALLSPGLTIIWLAGLIYGFLKGFDRNGLWIFAAMTLLMIFGNMVDQLLMGAKARQSGASWLGVILSTIAALIFSVLFPPFGGLVAALVVLFVVEVIRLRNIAKAGETTREMAVGCATAIIARFGIACLMIGLWPVVWLGGGGGFRGKCWFRVTQHHAAGSRCCRVSSLNAPALSLRCSTQQNNQTIKNVGFRVAKPNLRGNICINYYSTTTLSVMATSRRAQSICTSAPMGSTSMGSVWPKSMLITMGRSLNPSSPTQISRMV